MENESIDRHLLDGLVTCADRFYEVVQIVKSSNHEKVERKLADSLGLDEAQISFILDTPLTMFDEIVKLQKGKPAGEIDYTEMERMLCGKKRRKS